MKDGRNIIIGALLIAVLVMSVGYAAFATQLEINGNAKITGEWDIQITRIVVSHTTGNADGGTPQRPTTTSATFTAELEKPGDSVTYTVTVANRGTIDAKLQSQLFTPDDTEGSPAIKYTYTDAPSELDAGASNTFTITVEYDPEYEEVPEITEKTITVLLDYVQG